MNRIRRYWAMACLIAGAAGLARAAESIRPNVLVLMCDQLNLKALSCYGGPVDSTHIDSLARAGTRFEQACCPTPVCSPSRASLVTGMYPHAHGIVSNVADDPTRASRKGDGITAEDITTERLASEAGYVTHHYGKWHLCGQAVPYYPDMYRQDPEYAGEMKSVFDATRRLPADRWMKWYTHALPVTVAPPLRQAAARLGDRWDNLVFADFITNMGRLELPLKDVFDMRVADRTVAAIRSAHEQGKPFMITCSFNLPHDPNVVPSPYYEMFDPQKLPLPGNCGNLEARFAKEWSRKIVADLDEPSLREFLRIYYASVKLIDDQVGRVLRTLEDLKIADDTIVVFLADHGDMMGGHGMVWKSTTAFYDEVVRVPLIIRYPGRVRAQVSPSPVDLVDIMPTLLEWLGRKAPPQVQGHSLVPLLAGRNAAHRQYSFCERIPTAPDGSRKVRRGTKGNFMVRGNGWKYIRYSDGKEFLYDLQQDPGETRNLVEDGKCKAHRDELAAQLERWLTETGWPG